MKTKHFLFVLLSALCLVTVWAQPFDADIRQTADYKQGATWVPVLLRDMTNFPTFNQNTTGTAINVTGVVEIANGGTGTNSVAGVRSVLGLNTNDQPSFSTLRLTNNSGQINLAGSTVLLSANNTASELLFTVIGTRRLSIPYGTSGGLGIVCEANGYGFAAGNTTGAGISRTNFGLGGGITTNRTFVSYNGTNYTTNSVSIFNGIITGWTQ